MEPLTMHANRPTKIRHAVVACTMLMSLLLYLDRFCVSFAEIYIKQDLGLTDVEVGWMLSAFFWTYALAQVPAGWMTDRFGARRMLTIYVFGWSVFTGLYGLARGIGLLLAARFGCGIFQAGAYPTSAALLSRWVPLHARGTASGLVAVGGRVGGALAPLLTAILIVAMIPRGQTSQLHESDILDWNRLADQIASPSPQAGSERELQAWNWIASKMSVAARDKLQSIAHQALPSSTTEQARRQEARAAVLRDLNALLRDPTLVEQPFVEKTQLPREAKRLAARSSLDVTQQERLNRLILESLLRDSIKRLYVHGWRRVMFAYGLLGLPVAAIFWWVFRDRPEEHPACNEAERALIRTGRIENDAMSSRPLGPAPIIPLLTNLSMWLNCISQCTTNIGWVFLVTWLPRYLDEAHHVPVERRAVMTLIPVAVGFLGMVGGGRITDRLVPRIGLRWGRALPMGLSKFAAMAAYLCCLLDPSPWVAVALFSLVAFATDLSVAPIWAFCQDVGGRHVGSVLGWGNMWGNLGAAVTPPLLIWIVGEQKRWDLAFATCAAAFFVSGIAALGINASQPLVREEAQ